MIRSISDCAVLNNGVRMPWLGLGLWQVTEPAEAARVFRWAVEAGYRLFDTAKAYMNEAQVGAAIRGCGVPRGELFITTKVWNEDQGYESTLRAFEESRKNLGLEYVDLYLIHWPGRNRYADTWRALEKILRDGRARSIGVSNFQPHHLEDLFQASDIVPAVNQVEYHPLFSQRPLLTYCRERRIQLEAYCPLMSGREPLRDPVFARIGAKYGKTAAQVILRWDIQNGIVTIPKSSNPRRIAENADIFDFELSEEDMAAIDAMTRPQRMFSDPDQFLF